MPSKASKHIISSIQNSIFKEEFCIELEQLYKSNQIGALHNLEKLIEFVHQTPLETPQITASIKYFHRFLRIFGHEKITLLYPFVLKYLETRDLELSSVLKDFLQDVMVVDETIRDSLFKHYFRYCQEKEQFDLQKQLQAKQTSGGEALALRVDNSSVPLQILMGYSEIQTRVNSFCVLLSFD